MGINISSTLKGGFYSTSSDLFFTYLPQSFCAAVMYYFYIELCNDTSPLFLSFTGYGQSAIINISAPDSAVELGSNIRIEITKLSPNISSPSFDRLDCGAMLSGESTHKTIIAQYDKHSSKFKTPSHGIPSIFKDKVSYVGRMSLVIHRIRFEDKFMKIVCILNYKNGSMTLHVDSPAYEIKMVYG